MNGTTLCPHCNTRFKITEAQLTAHQGMVRCGHCLQIFDARTGFEPDRQLELPIPDSREQGADDITNDLAGVVCQPSQMASSSTRGQIIGGLAAAETAPSDLLPEATEPAPGETPGSDSRIAASVGSADTASPSGPDIANVGGYATSVVAEFPQDSDASAAEAETGAASPVQTEPAHEETPCFIEPVAAPGAPQTLSAGPLQPLTLAEQVAILHDEDDGLPQAKRRNWHWAIAALLLLLVLLAQTAYFFRVDLAARYPELKPVLADYCRMLDCSIPLPQHADFMGIESSGLEADQAHENQITLNALLRNRAAYAQAFPHLELTLNDSQDKPLARRALRPADYLPPLESEEAGLLPNHELNIKLQLDTTDLKPAGYRLVLFYPHQ